MERPEGKWAGSSNEEQEDTYQASYLKGMEEKKNHHLRGCRESSILRGEPSFHLSRKLKGS